MLQKIKIKIKKTSAACAPSSSPFEDLQYLFKNHLVGQDFAKDIIPEAILSHSKTKALTFHFAGGLLNPIERKRIHDFPKRSRRWKNFDCPADGAGFLSDSRFFGAHQ